MRVSLQCSKCVVLSAALRGEIVGFVSAREILHPSFTDRPAPKNALLVTSRDALRLSNCPSGGGAPAKNSPRGDIPKGATMSPRGLFLAKRPSEGLAGTFAQREDVTTGPFFGRCLQSV